MKKMLVLLFVVFIHPVFAQKSIGDLTLKKIHPEKSISSRNWVKAFISLATYTAPDSVSKIGNEVTMFFTELNIKTTISHTFYIQYLTLADYFLEKRLEARLVQLKESEIWGHQFQKQSGPTNSD
ncbi:MAG: hypothetical protein JWM92_384 [Candidatus Nomurabacteria bacterium]|jgi:hypothetical protein|nr:hypothetical protein [Candidatus Nomurabacteria bacterium]